MPCLKRKLAALAIILFTVLAPSVSFASTSCECFCGVEGKGATDQGAMTSDKCKDKCTGAELQFVGCFTDDAQYPVENDKCWTKKECDDWSDQRGSVVVGATWGEEFPAECGTTKSTKEEMHYCYSDEVPYALNINIGNVTSVNDLPTYINAVYTWLLPAATLIAVVMMMIGGLQYTLARGKPKYIDKAKTRITNAITGVVILLSIFVILNLIDPRLTNLENLKIPLIKEVTMLDPTSACERLEDYGYTVEPVVSGETVCGKKGTITDDSGLKDNALGSWKVGDTCDYQTCTNPGTTCTRFQDVTACFSCTANTSPSDSTCASFEQGNPIVPGEDQYVYCRYDPDGQHTTASGGLGDGVCTGIQNKGGGLSQNYLNCEKARADAAYNFVEVDGPEYPGCSYYETLMVIYPVLNEHINTEAHADLLQEICEDDPCGLAADNGASRCVYNSGTQVTDYFFGLVSDAENTYHCRTVK